MTNQEFQIYGISEKDIRDEYMNSPWNKLAGTEMTIMSILSDAQHVLECGDSNQARKYMNIAKFILADMMEKRLEGK